MAWSVVLYGSETRGRKTSKDWGFRDVGITKKTPDRNN